MQVFIYILLVAIPAMLVSLVQVNHSGSW